MKFLLALLLLPAAAGAQTLPEQQVKTLDAEISEYLDQQIRKSLAPRQILASEIKFNDATTMTTAPSTATAATLSFESAEIAVTASSNIYVSHGLGGMPKLFQASVRCKTAEFGYAVGDELLIPTTDGGESAYRNAVWANSTIVGVALGSRPLLIQSRATDTFETLTAGNWRIVLKAIR